MNDQEDRTQMQESVPQDLVRNHEQGNSTDDAAGTESGVDTESGENHTTAHGLHAEPPPSDVGQAKGSNNQDGAADAARPISTVMNIHTSDADSFRRSQAQVASRTADNLSTVSEEQLIKLWDSLCQLVTHSLDSFGRDAKREVVGSLNYCKDHVLEFINTGDLYALDMVRVRLRERLTANKVDGVRINRRLIEDLILATCICIRRLVLS